MYSIDIYDKSGKKVSKFELNETIFSDEKINEPLIHEYYLLQTSNARKNIAKVKWRWEVNWSWKKLYKQKWTWNARVGDKNSPIRKWWWVAFGPRWEKNFTRSMPQKARRLALNWLLTIKVKAWEILWLQEFKIDKPQTKEALGILKSIWIQDQKTLLVLDKKNENIIKSFRNLEKIKYLLVDYLNPYDIMNYNKILILEPALKKLNEN